MSVRNGVRLESAFTLTTALGTLGGPRKIGDGHHGAGGASFVLAGANSFAHSILVGEAGGKQNPSHRGECAAFRPPMLEVSSSASIRGSTSVR